jgi:hypothetical protein
MRLAVAAAIEHVAGLRRTNAAEVAADRQPAQPAQPAPAGA